MKKSLLLASIVLFTTGRLALADDPGLGSDNVGGVDAGQGTGGSVVAFTANEYRDIDDLKIWGGVGNHQLVWSRHANSRRTTNASLFGDGHFWRHSYQWDLTVSATNSSLITVEEPDGTQWNFTQVSGAWTAAPGCPETLVANGSGFTYQRSNGYRYHFSLVAGAYQLTDFCDDIGTTYTLSYNSNGQLVQVSEPGGRNLQIFYTTVSSSTASTNNNLTVVDHVATSDGRSVQYQYTPFYDPLDPASNGQNIYHYATLTVASYSDGTSAAYTYAQVAFGLRPLVSEYNDVRAETAQQHSRTVYLNATGINSLGQVDHIVNPATGGTILTVSLVGRSASTATSGTYNAVNPGTGGLANHPTVTFANGGTVTQHYVNGLLSTETDANGNTTTYTYEANGFISSKTDPMGNVTGYVNNAFDGVLQQTNALGGMDSWTRNSLNSVTSHTDALGRVTILTRDASNRVTAISYPDGSTESFTYNNFNEPLTHTQRNGGIEFFAYDGTGLLLSKTNALGQVTGYGYDSASRLNRVTDARGNITNMLYNERGFVTQITNPDGSSRTRSYNATGDLLSETNELGNTWTYAYDPTFHKLLSVTDPLGHTTTTTYLADSAESKPLAVTLPSGKQTVMTYDLGWNLLATTLGAGSADAATTRFTYDANDNMLTKVDGNGKTWSTAYDVLNRKTSEQDPLGNLTRCTYDAVGNVIREIRPDGNNNTTHAYDAMNRMTQTTDASNNLTIMAYDASGNLLSLTNQRGKTFSYTYDLLNRKLTMVYPKGNPEIWTYDAAGNMATYTTRAGQVCSYTYDNRNRNTAYTWSGNSAPAVTKSYDAAGRLLTLVNSASSVSFAYDVANQQTAETQTVTGQSAHTLAYSYDADGNRLTLGYPSGLSVVYAYTNRNQINSISANGSQVAAFTYDSNGNRLTKSLANGITATCTYDVASRLTGVINGSVAAYNYTLDVLGRRTSRTETSPLGSGTDNYAYDPINEITNVAYGSGRTVTYSYNGTGNRTSVVDSGTSTAYSVNAVDQYTTVGSQSLSYDNDGNLTIPNTGTSYTYDAQNRFVSGTGGGNSVAVTYDAQNRVVSRTINGTKTCFAYDGWNLIEEYDATGNVLASYVQGPNMDEPLCRITSRGTNYYSQDGNHNVTAITDQNGNTVERYKYDVFGAVMITDPSGYPRTSTAVGNRFLFTGREYVSQLGLYDYRNRVYSPSLGRFLQTDPIRFNAGDVNLYRYCGNDAVDMVDQLGLKDNPNDEDKNARRQNALNNHIADRKYQLDWLQEDIDKLDKHLSRITKSQTRCENALLITKVHMAIKAAEMARETAEAFLESNPVAAANAIHDAAELHDLSNEASRLQAGIDSHKQHFDFVMSEKRNLMNIRHSVYERLQHELDKDFPDDDD